MPRSTHHIVTDAQDLPDLAGSGLSRSAGRFSRRARARSVIATHKNAAPGNCFMPVTDPKTVRNRLHPDLTSSATDRDQKIDGLLALGTCWVDIGQTCAESWTALADPEENEFYMARLKETLIH